MWGRPQPVNGHTLALTPRGDILQAGIFRGTVTLGPNTLTAQGSGDGFVASFNGQTGLPQWAVAVGGTGQELLKDISVGPNATAYVYGHSGEASAAPSSFPLGAAVVLGPGTFLARMSLNTNRLEGEVYLNGNGNGTRDTGEIAFPRPVLVESALHSATSDPATGRFTVFADTGYYDLRLPQAPPRFTVQEGASGYQGSFTAYGQSATNLNFGLAAIVNQQDLRVTLSPYSPARPGQVTRYRARLENVGTTVVASGEVAATLDAAAIIIGTVPVASQSQGQTRIWAFTNLPPFAVRDYDITFSLPVTTPPGTILVSTATATAAGGTDVNSADNTDVLQHTVTASFDPNDISVNYTQLTLAQVAAGEKLDYLIRFENLGTDTAFAVTVVDSLPGDFLQLGTVQLVGTSHNVQWSLADGVLTLRFPGIRLPQQAVDALRSKGFVRFRVKPRPTLLDGTLIPGRAHITFDFNAPITTNLVTTLVGGFVTGAPDALSGSADWTLYPNPATATVTLTADAARAGRATVRLLDAVGRTVRTCELAVTPGPARLPLDVRGLPAGVYAVHLALPGVPPTARRLLVR